MGYIQKLPHATNKKCLSTILIFFIMLKNATEIHLRNLLEIYNIHSCLVIFYNTFRCDLIEMFKVLCTSNE